MPSFAESPLSLKVSLMLSSLAFLLIVIGMATPYWNDDHHGTSHFGLWTVCINLDTLKGCMSIDTSFGDASNIPGWFHAVQALEVLAVVLSFGAVILIAVCLFVDYVGRNKYPHVAAMIACYITAVFAIVGTIVWAAKWEDTLSKQDIPNPVKYLSWSFALVIVGGVFSVVSGIFMILDVRRRWYL